MECKGPRIRAATHSESLVVLAAPRLRYQAKRRGYHGGVCPAEMVVPCLVLRSANTELPEEWNDLPPYEPGWWSSRTPVSEPATPPSPTAPVQSRRPAPKEDQGDLFHVAAIVKGETSDWISKLLSSEVYQEQARQAVRGAPPVDR